MNAEQMAKKYSVRGVALRNLLRARPELTPKHKWHHHYRIDPEVEERIVRHPDFARLPRRGVGRGQPSSRRRALSQAGRSRYPNRQQVG
jgi:hypothetical protein